MTSFGSAPNASLPDKFAFTNKVNDDLVVARAYVTDKGSVAFDYHIPVEGGITKRNIVLSIKRYLSVLEVAVALDTKGVLA